jgi:hypothetical protein
VGVDLNPNYDTFQLGNKERMNMEMYEITVDRVPQAILGHPHKDLAGQVLAPFPD